MLGPWSETNSSAKPSIRWLAQVQDIGQTERRRLESDAFENSLICRTCTNLLDLWLLKVFQKRGTLNVNVSSVVLKPHLMCLALQFHFYWVGFDS